MTREQDVARGPQLQDSGTTLGEEEQPRLVPRLPGSGAARGRGLGPVSLKNTAGRSWKVGSGKVTAETQAQRSHARWAEPKR